MFFRFGSIRLLIFALLFLLPCEMNELEAHGGGHRKGRRARGHGKGREHRRSDHDHDGHHDNHNHRRNKYRHQHHYYGGSFYTGGSDDWHDGYGYNRGYRNYPYDPYDYNSNYPIYFSGNNADQLEDHKNSNFNYHNTFSINESQNERKSKQNETFKTKKGVFFSD